MILTEDKFKQCIPNNFLYQFWYKELEPQLEKYGLNSIPRIAMFLAQCSHESSEFRILEENLNYSKDQLLKVWPKLFNEDNVLNYARQKERIANRAYSSRMGNGDESSGDGWRFHGRGIIQLTGRENYTNLTKATGVDFITNPDELLKRENSVLAACWFWDTRKLNAPSDTADINTVTKRINGGLIGISDRLYKYNNILTILKG